MENARKVRLEQLSVSVNRALAQSTYIGDRSAYLSACKRLTCFSVRLHILRIEHDK